MLRSKIGGASHLGDIAVYDAEGELISWSRDQPLPKVNVSARAYFQTFKSNPASEPVPAKTRPGSHTRDCFGVTRKLTSLFGGLQPVAQPQHSRADPRSVMPMQ